MFHSFQKKQQVPSNTWYFNQHNGATLAVQAWYAEAAMSKIRTRLRPGVQLKTWEIWRDTREVSLIFTDCNITQSQTEYKRYSGNVAGDMKDFAVFREIFILEPHVLYVPSSKELDVFETRHVLGNMNDPADFFLKMVGFAHDVVKKAERDFR